MLFFIVANDEHNVLDDLKTECLIENFIAGVNVLCGLEKSKLHNTLLDTDWSNININSLVYLLIYISSLGCRHIFLPGVNANK